MRLIVLLALLVLSACSSAPSSNKEQVSPKDVGPAPAVFRVNFDTSKGPFAVEVHHAWAPYGADRFYELVEKKFYDGARFFRIVKGFIVQFGISGDPRASEHWRAMNLPDDPVKMPNSRGTISYAMAGPGTRTTQVFINVGENAAQLDQQGFAPFGRVIEGMDVVDRLDAEYGEAPDQQRLETEGNAYLAKEFPNLDYIKTARVVGGAP